MMDKGRQRNAIRWPSQRKISKMRNDQAMKFCWGSRTQKWEPGVVEQACNPTPQEVEIGSQSIISYTMSLRPIQVPWDCLKWNKTRKDGERRSLCCTRVYFKDACAENRGETRLQRDDSVYINPENKPGKSSQQLFRSEMCYTSEGLGFFQHIGTSWIGFTLWKTIKLQQFKYTCVSVLFCN